MRKYELMILVDPNLQEEQKTTLLDKIQQTIKTNQGKVNRVNKWGKRTLSYEIKRYREAFYIIIDFNLEPKNISELERSIKFDEEIIRYLIVLKQEKVVSKNVQEKEQ